MKRRLLTLLLAGAAAAGSVLALLGCRIEPVTSGDASGEVTALSIVSNAMNYGDCYSFRLRNTGEEILFSCSEDDGSGRVEFEDMPMPPAFMEQFTRLLMDTQLDLITADKAGKKKPSAPDKTSWTVSVTWKTGAERTMYEKPPEEAAVRSFFSKAARAYGIPEDEAGALTYLYISASASWIEGSFSFDVHEKKGGYLFSAYFTEVLYAEEGNWEEHTVELNDAALSDAQLEAIRQAVRESGLYDSLASNAARWISPKYDEAEIPMDATTYHISAGWEKRSFSDSGWGDPHYEPLLSVLKETARTLES